MGQAIEKIAVAKGHEIVMKISIDNLEDNTIENIQQADVAIEFTGPESAYDNVIRCIEAGVPLVCGSTGWLNKYDEVTALVKEKNGTLLYASNFSIGVNIFFELNRKLAELMAPHTDYDVSMVEIHHTQKLDAPSGTAITLAEQVMEKITRKQSWVNDTTENPAELSILSERIDPAPGTHKIKYSSSIDDIEIIHTAHNRTGFASGAVLAAEYIAGKKGIFSMKEVLGL